MTTHAPAVSPALPVRHRGPWREIAAASIGNALEFYDLLIYGYFAVVIGKSFFPSDNETTSLLLSVGTFGISFLMRPLGAMVLGSYADHAGRKAALTVSIMLMMLGTAMITFMPSYSEIGLLAPLVVVVARMIQGFSTGGEFGAATAFMVEHAAQERRGFFASWQISTQGLATLFAAGVSAALSAVLTDAQVTSYGWRIAFGVGLLIGPVGLYIRSQIEEAADFKAVAENAPQKTPLRDVLVKGRLDLLLAIGVVAGATAFSYVHKLYMPTYALKQLHITATSSYMGACMTGLTLMVMAPVFGTLSDDHGRFRVLTIALLVTGLSSYPLFLLLNLFPTVLMLICVQAMVGVLLAACLAPIPAMLADVFPIHIRGTGLALSYNFSVTLFGGFAPLTVTWLIDVTANNLAPSFYVIATSALSVFAVLILGRRMRARANF